MTGIAGGVMGGLSLGWNIASYLLAGGRASVKMETGLYMNGNLFAMPSPKEGINVYDNPLTAPVDHVLIVRVHSKGRQAMTIDGVMFSGRTGATYLPTQFVQGALPARLEAYASHTIVLRLPDINLQAHEVLRRMATTELRLRAAVQFGNGKTKRSKSLRFYAGEDPHIELARNPDDSDECDD
ncbi:hypothetical protein ACOBQX_17950 [Actinokineospora sp. G85]|uniref:hypothetical protein n=1 Tax=Actinokineospora sp. G85 TaxID=3406626 RepID=UPI003C750CF9